VNYTKDGQNGNASFLYDGERAALYFPYTQEELDQFAANGRVVDPNDVYWTGYGGVYRAVWQKTIAVFPKRWAS
jgi:hypothetical protein